MATKTKVVGLLALQGFVAMAVPCVSRAMVYSYGGAAQKLRAGIGRQRVAYLEGLTRAALACEKTGALPGVECAIATGSATSPADPEGKFASAVRRCDDKLDYARNAPEGSTSQRSYELIGCPGDADAASPGRQRFSDL